MTAGISAPATNWRDAFDLVIYTIPLALLYHQILAQALKRSSQKEELKASRMGFKALGFVNAERRFRWTALSLLLSWLPILVMVLGAIGCSLLRDAGFQIFPWAVLGASVLCGVALPLCQKAKWMAIRNRAASELRNL